MLVFVAGWTALVATSNPGRLAASFDLEGTIPVRNGHGQATVVVDVEGFYVDERPDVLIEVMRDAGSGSIPDGGATSAIYSVSSPDGAVSVFEGSLADVPSNLFVSYRPAALCADPSGCTLTVPIAIDAAPGTDADVLVSLDVHAYGDHWNFDLGREHIDARLEVVP